MSFSDSADDIKTWRNRDSRHPDLGRCMRLSGIPAKYYDLGWDDYQDSTAVTRADGSRDRLKDVLQDYMKNFSTRRSHGLVLLGPAGAGKTFGASLVALGLVREHAWVRYSTYAKITKRRQELIRLDMQAQSSFDWTAAEPARQWLDICTDYCDLLVLDDVGKEYRAKSGYSDAGLDDLLRSRTELGKATIITSNLSPCDWESYNSSMASFLHELGEVVEVERSTDFRRPTRRRTVQP